MSCDQKRLSVVIPGCETPDRYWRRCLFSVLANLGEDDEVICVDDGSSRRPDFLQEEFASKDSRVRVIFLDRNAGLPSARNAGLEVARGKYVTFVDSDDELIRGAYDRALTALGGRGADLAVFGVRSIWVDERLMMSCVPHEIDSRMLAGDDVVALHKEGVLNFAWNKVYKRAFLDENGIRFEPEGVPCEDIIFVLKCCVAGAKWVSVSQEGIKYLRTHGSLLSKYKPTFLKGRRLAAETWRAYWDSCGESRDARGKLGEVSERELLLGEWDNIWRTGSPYSLSDKIAFAKANQGLYKGPVFGFVLKKLLFSILRRWLYVRPVQRWHIRHVYPSVAAMVD